MKLDELMQKLKEQFDVKSFEKFSAIVETYTEFEIINNSLNLLIDQYGLEKVLEVIEKIKIENDEIYDDGDDSE
jgi:hypothetical protein